MNNKSIQEKCHNLSLKHGIGEYLTYDETGELLRSIEYLLSTNRLKQKKDDYRILCARVRIAKQKIKDAQKQKNYGVAKECREALQQLHGQVRHYHKFFGHTKSLKNH